MEALWILGGLAFGAFALIAGYQHAARARGAWRDYAERRGHVFEGGGAFGSQAVRGESGPFRIALTPVSRGSGKSRRTFTRLEIDARGFVPSTIAISAEDFVTNLKKAFGSGDIETGDPSFDAAAHVRGDAVAALALLDRETRRSLERALAAKIVVADGLVAWETSGWFHDVDGLIALEDEMLRLARSLTIDADDDEAICRRLFGIITGDEPSALRRRCLEVLVARHPDREETAAAARAMLADPSPEVRLTAATAAAGPDGDATLAALVADAVAPDSVGARALDVLCARASPDVAGGVVLHALDAKPGERLRSAIRWSGRLRPLGAGERLENLSARGDLDGDTAFEIASALGTLGDPSREGAAIRLLASTEDRVRLAAVKTLGEIGGRDAVSPLLPLARGFLPFGEIRIAAAAAIRAIQERLGDGERGALAIAEILPADGALSEAPPEEGRLSSNASSAGRDPEVL